LNTASGSSRQYYSNLGLLQDALHKIGDSLEDVASEKMPPEKLLQKLKDLHEHLESQRPLLTEVETVSGQLCAVLNDASSQQKVNQKFSHMGKNQTLNIHKLLWNSVASTMILEIPFCFNWVKPKRN